MQVLLQFPGRAVPSLRVLVEALQGDRLDVARQSRHQPRRRHWLCRLDLLQGLQHGGAAERGTPGQTPFREAFGGWVLGSDRYLARLREVAGSVRSDPPPPEARQLAGLDPEAILEAVSEHYGLHLSDLAHWGDPHIARAIAAWLCRRHCEVPLYELAPSLRLARADSVPNLPRRIDARLKSYLRLANDLYSTG